MRPTLLLFLFIFSIHLSGQNDSIKQRGKKFVYKGEHKLFKTRYDSIRHFSDGRAGVMKQGKWGFIDTAGKVIVPLYFSNVSDYHGGIAAVRNWHKSPWQMIDINGIEDKNYGYDTIIFTDSLAIAKRFYHWSNGVDTHVDIWKYPGEIIYNKVDSVAITGDVMLVIYDYDRTWTTYYHQENSAQLISTNGAQLTERFYAKDSLLLQPEIVVQCHKGDMAVLNMDGTISPFYSAVTEFNDSLYLVRSNKQSGLMNKSLQVTLPVAYAEIEAVNRSLILRIDSLYFLADYRGTPLSAGYIVLKQSGANLIASANQNGLYAQLLDSNGKIISATYGYIFPEQNGISRVISEDYMHYSYINAGGEQIAPWFDRTVRSETDYETMEKDGGTDVVGRILAAFATAFLSEALIDWDKPALREHRDEDAAAPYVSFPGHDPKYLYSYGSDFRGGFAYTTTKYKKRKHPSWPLEEFTYLGVMDTSGKQILKNEYTNIVRHDSVFILEKPGGFGLATITGKILLPATYRTIEELGSGYFSIGKGEYEALYHVQGDTGIFITQFLYYSIEKQGGGLFVVASSRWYYDYMDRSGKVVIRKGYTNASPFSDGRAHVQTKDGEWMYIDKTGKRVE